MSGPLHASQNKQPTLFSNLNSRRFRAILTSGMKSPQRTRYSMQHLATSRAETDSATPIPPGRHYPHCRQLALLFSRAMIPKILVASFVKKGLNAGRTILHLSAPPCTFGLWVQPSALEYAAAAAKSWRRSSVIHSPLRYAGPYLNAHGRSWPPRPATSSAGANGGLPRLGHRFPRNSRHPVSPQASATYSPRHARDPRFSNQQHATVKSEAKFLPSPAAVEQAAPLAGSIHGPDATRCYEMLRRSEKSDVRNSRARRSPASSEMDL